MFTKTELALMLLSEMVTKTVNAWPTFGTAGIVPAPVKVGGMLGVVPGRVVRNRSSVDVTIEIVTLSGVRRLKVVRFWNQF
jgi:hypothetical protein